MRSSLVNDGSYRDWNQRTVPVKHDLQCLFGRKNNLGVDLSQRLKAFSPLARNAVMETQRIYGTHGVNLAVTAYVPQYLSAVLAFASPDFRGVEPGQSSTLGSAP
jgi:hypothetical protein